MTLAMTLALGDLWEYVVGGAETKDGQMSFCPEKDY